MAMAIESARTFRLAVFEGADDGTVIQGSPTGRFECFELCQREGHGKVPSILTGKFRKKQSAWKMFYR